MKNKILSIALTTALCLTLCACGSKEEASNTVVENESVAKTEAVVEVKTSVENTEAPIETVEQTTEEAQTVVETETATAESTEPVEEVVPTWFDEHGLTLTPAGAFSFNTMSAVADDNGNPKDYELFNVPANMTIDVVTEGVEEGYKNIIYTVFYDKSNMPEGTGWLWNSTLIDGYTGVTLDIGDTYVDSETTTAINEHYQTITFDGVDYNVGATQSTEYGETTLTQVFTVKVPVDYDGVTLAIGYSDATSYMSEVEAETYDKDYLFDKETCYFGIN
ncbi:MAG: hypothetical protein IJ326_13400 [Lachnospiraceae bacterium]|nr:hypothetical protein [Lachnospiraceae bacterium]